MRKKAISLLFYLWVLLEYNGHNKLSYHDEKEDGT